MVCYDVEVEPGLQPVTGEDLNRGANQEPDAGLDIHARGFLERQRSAYFDIRVGQPNADPYKDLTSNQLYRQQEQEKKGKDASRVKEATTGGMGEEYIRCHCRLAELLSIKKEDVQRHYFMVSGQGFVCITEGALLWFQG